MKLTSILAGWLTGTLAWSAEQRVSSHAALAHAFAAPPHEANPWVYWWFLGGYYNPEGMARDIAAMKETGHSASRRWLRSAPVSRPRRCSRVRDKSGVNFQLAV